MKILLPVAVIALLAGCASPPPPPVVVKPPPVVVVKPAPPAIDRSLSAKGQSSRVKFIVIHYTVSDLPQSIKILTEQSVSAHYLLTDQNPPVVYGLVDESRQSNHAGVSSWKTYTQINVSSVGIEIVNPGFTEGPEGRTWYAFPQYQIDRLIVLLKEIVARHNIPPENILGHSDVAPQRKQDPGPMFPWYQLAQHGLIVWPDATRVAAMRPLFEQQLPDATWFQTKLALHGYAVPRSGILDAQTRAVISAFQMKYRPAIFDGTPDAETAAMLDVLTSPAAAALPPTTTQPVDMPAAPATAPSYRPAAPAPAAPGTAPSYRPAAPAPAPSAAPANVYLPTVPAATPSAPVSRPAPVTAPSAAPPAAPSGAPLVTPSQAPQPGTAPLVTPSPAPQPATTPQVPPSPAPQPAATPGAPVQLPPASPAQLPAASPAQLPPASPVVLPPPATPPVVTPAPVVQKP